MITLKTLEPIINTSTRIAIQPFRTNPTFNLVSERNVLLLKLRRTELYDMQLKYFSLQIIKILILLNSTQPIVSMRKHNANTRLIRNYINI